MIMVPCAFVRLIPVTSNYTILRRNSEDVDAGMDAHHSPAVQHSRITSAFESTDSTRSRSHSVTSIHAHEANVNEGSALMSNPEYPRLSTESFVAGLVNEELANSDESVYPDIRGVALLKSIEFWQLFLTMGLLSGIGLMTIK